MGNEKWKKASFPCKGECGLINIPHRGKLAATSISYIETYELHIFYHSNLIYNTDTKTQGVYNISLHSHMAMVNTECNWHLKWEYTKCDFYKRQKKNTPLSNQYFLISHITPGLYHNPLLYTTTKKCKSSYAKGSTNKQILTFSTLFERGNSKHNKSINTNRSYFNY